MAGEYYPKCPACNLSHPGTCNDPLRPPLAPEQVFINPRKVPGTVEDSHAKLAAEMREPPGFWHPKAPEWAARVERLGTRTKFYAEQEANLRVAMLRMYQVVDALHAEKAAREAEIATVREEIAKAWPDRITIGDLKEWAARLGGATS